MSRYSTLLISLMALVLIAPNLAQAQEVGSHARIVRISYAEGTVQLNGAPATVNSPITQDAVLVTGSDGLAEVEFEDGSMIRLASETQITFSQLARLTSGEAITRVDLDEGEAEFLIPASSAGKFAVNAHSKNVLFAQPGRFRILSTKSSPLEIAVWKGEAGVRDRESGLAIRVSKNETFTLNPNDPGQYNLEAALVADDLDQWSKQRDESLQAAPLSSTYTTAPSAPTYSNTYIFSGYSQPYLNYGYGFSSFGGCPSFDPFWFGASNPSYCWNSGVFFSPFFVSPFFGQPFFFAPPFVVVAPVRPRHPIPIRPPVPPVVAKGEPVSAPANSGVRTLRFDGGPKRVFNEDNLPRIFPRVGITTSGEAVTGGNVRETPQGQASEIRRVSPGGVTLIAPGQRSAAGTGPVSQPQHASPGSPSPAASRLPATHVSAPSLPVQRVAPSAPPMRSVSPPPSMGSRGMSGPAMSAPHSSGRPR